MEEKKKQAKDYVENYSIILIVIAFIMLFSGVYIGLNVNWLAACICWGSTATYLLLLNLIKDVLQELRILNNK